MGKTRLLTAAFAALAVGGLSGCATPGDQAGGIAARHQHLRDSKQGPAASTIAASEQAAMKPLHDHREMK